MRENVINILSYAEEAVFVTGLLMVTVVIYFVFYSRGPR